LRATCSPGLDAIHLAAGRQIAIGLGLILLTVYGGRLGACDHG
jgi:hypothetical protein